MSETTAEGNVPSRRRRFWGSVAVLLGMPASILLILYGLYAWNYLLLFKLGPLTDLQAIEVTWRGQRIGYWDDPSRLREFRASLPRWTEEMGGSKCGEGSVTILHLHSGRRTTDLALPHDSCCVINGGKGRHGYCFAAPKTLRLVGTWLTADPEAMNRLRQQDKPDEPFADRYGRLREQVRWWSTGQSGPVAPPTEPL